MKDKNKLIRIYTYKKNHMCKPKRNIKYDKYKI